ncbi:MAG: hypothetical protein JWN08_2787 [Frankiales bacterium]|nr:hypothetical protein [Frankiales bacterium]
MSTAAATPAVPPAATPPIVVTGRLDAGLSRWLWLLKWLLALPHFLVLVGLWVGFLVCSVIALVAVLVTGRYPRPLFAYTSGVLRWSWRVAYYAYGALGTDRYPPFSLADDPTYPARLEVAYPEHLSRGLVLVKWWLLALPHYLVLSAFLGGGSWLASRDADAAPGLLHVLVLVAGVVLLFTGRYPRGVFDLVLGIDRWVLRVAAYAGLLTDAYPPFRLDQGGGDPDEHVLSAPAAAPARRRGGGTAALVLGAVLLVPGLALAASGAAALVADQVLRDDDGYLTSPAVDLETSTAALVSEPVDMTLEGPDWTYWEELLGDARVTVDDAVDGEPLFLGVGPTARVERYLSGFPHDRVVELGDDTTEVRREGGDGQAAPPAPAGVWTATDSGTGRLSVSLPVPDGSWTAVVMRADAEPGLLVRAEAGATLPDLDVLGWSALAGGLVLLAAGTALVVAGARQAHSA